MFQAGLLHLVIHAGNDLAHCVLRYAAVRAAKIAVADKWQAHGALAGVVGDGVCHQRNAAFLRDLLHDLGFANARRAHQQNRPLADGRNQRGAGIVHGKVCLDRVFNFLFGAFDVHGGVHSFIKTLGTNKMNYNSGRSSASFSCQSISGVLGTGSGKNSSGLKTSRMAQGGVSGGGVPVSKNRKAVS